MMFLSHRFKSGVMFIHHPVRSRWSKTPGVEGLSENNWKKMPLTVRTMSVWSALKCTYMLYLNKCIEILYTPYSFTLYFYPKWFIESPVNHMDTTKTSRILQVHQLCQISCAIIRNNNTTFRHWSFIYSFWHSINLCIFFVPHGPP